MCVWVWVLFFSHKPSTRLINLDIAHIGRRACEEMVKKKRVLIYANSEIHEKAKELGFNISKLCENAMKESIDRLSAPHYQEEIKNSPETLGAGSGTRTHEGLRHRSLSPAP